jgi:prepilin-type N-terminal cleavage/methylation domain-containing protein
MLLVVIFSVLVIYSKKSRFMQKKAKKIKAFTLIEVLVVATILGVLVTIAVVSFSNAQRKSRDARRQADLEMVRQALILYRQDNGSYGNIGSDNAAFNALITTLYNEEYLTSDVVADPKNNANYFYSIVCPTADSPNCSKVGLSATLEADGTTYEILTP